MRYLILSLLLAPAAFAATVDSAYYAPDRGTPYEWFEGAQAIRQYFEKDYRAAGYLYLYVRNGGTEPIRATRFTLDGKALADCLAAQEVVWWRLLPRPLAPGRIGEVMVRLREALAQPGELGVEFDDGTRVQATIRPEPNPVRISTLGFSRARNRVFLVADRLTAEPQEVSRVLLDGRDVTAQCRLLAPRFEADCAPISLRLSQPLARGSYHVYTVVTKSGARASCCGRTLDGWVPLGSYGYGTLEEYARNGGNGYANFGRSSKGQLDSEARLGMRGVSMLGGSDVRPDEVGHPGLYAHYLMDEPDCHDYNVKDLPHPLRIGSFAPEMERRAQRVREQNPSIPSFLTLDLTYKPANYYIYGPIADILNPDCYPIAGQRELVEVREVVETARLGAGARPVTFTFQGVMEGPRDPEAFEKLRFPRPNFAAEERIMLYYAIGAGARGLFNYIHCTENSETRWSRGTGEFPDVWNEIGLVYRELEHVAPLVALAHPTKLATTETPKLWLRTLLCGEEGALVVWVNDNYEQHRLGFRYEPQADVRIALPKLPWLAGWRAYAVHAKGFTGLGREGDEILLPRAEVGGLILVAAKPGLAQRLTRRYEERQRQLGAQLLAQWRYAQGETARVLNLRRLIAGELGEYAVVGEGVKAYGRDLPGVWNPLQEKYNVIASGANDRDDTVLRGADFKLTIPAQRVGQRHVIYAMVGVWGPAARLAVTGPDGQKVVERQVTGNFGGELLVGGFVPGEAGEYVLSYRQGGPGARGARISHVIYVVPESAVFAPLPLPE